MIAARKIEFGDFQTPLELAREITAFLAANGEGPDVVLEPTCGLGSFVVAAIDSFHRARTFHAFDINPEYVRHARNAVHEQGNRKLHFECRNFFEVDWCEFFVKQKGTILVIGNPPWVTNSAIGTLGGNNLPAKTNFQRHNGFAAKTGKANFDISEWMLIRLLEALHQRAGCVAMLCKMSTARKTLRHAWLNRLNVGRCSLHLINAGEHFGAAVEACLLIIHTGVAESATTAAVYPDLSFNGKMSTLGLVGKELIADIEQYVRLRDFDGLPYYTWRSGVKHDAAAVMELTKRNGCYVNGKHEECRLEAKYLFPLLKSSDLANGRLTPERYVLLTQRKPSDETAEIEKIAPKTWAYLVEHGEHLDHRRSIIYEKRSRFSVFGIGDYTFSPWKVAISGLYKNCRFQVVGKHQGKPIVLDDTCYFIPCAFEKEARFICELLNSEVCQRFLRSLVFFDAKRPIIIDILNRIDLKRVAEHLNRATEGRKFLSMAAGFEDRQALLVFENKEEYKTGGSRKRRVRCRRRS